MPAVGAKAATVASIMDKGTVHGMLYATLDSGKMRVIESTCISSSGDVVDGMIIISINKDKEKKGKKLVPPEA